MTVKTVLAGHAWLERPNKCVCCWQWCPRCRKCQCQIETMVRGKRAAECQELPR